MPGNAIKGRRPRAARSAPALLSWPVRRLEAAALAAFWFLCRRLPVEVATSLGQRVLSFVGPRLKKHRHVRRNLSLALPERPAGEIEALGREVWGNLGAVIAEYPHLNEICGRGTDPRIELVVMAELDVFREPARPGVFVGAHLANWELLAGKCASTGVPLTVVYTPEPNPLIARMLQIRRRALGCDFVAKSEGLRPLMRDLSKGTSIGLIVDRRNDRGERLPFFGREAALSTSPARLALKFGCQLVPVRVERIGASRFRVTIYPPIEPDEAAAGDAEKALRMTRRLYAIFEDWIAESPGDWFCSKRIWPKDKSRSKL